jgi:GT2 family glycosyltransferase
VRPTCSVIIPVFNRAALTRQLLRSLLDGPPQGTVDFEVVVVDDASTDLTESLLVGYANRLRTVRHTANAGFAVSCNDGAALAAGRYLVFLNNDTLPQAGWLDALVQYAEARPNVAAVGSKLLFTDSTVQHAGVAIGLDRFPWHLYAGFPAEHPAVNKSRRVQIVTGACMAIRREVFEELGGFDTAFRNGYEDVDLCLRIGARGYEIHYCHRSILYHLEAVTRESRADEIDDNLRLYRGRWFDRVVPDDLQYYAEDGLLSANYRETYPIELAISAEVAVVDTDARDRQTERLLNARSRTAFKLLRDNVRMNVRVQEAELRALARAGLGLPAARPETIRAAVADPRLLFKGSARALSTGRHAGLISIVLSVRNNAADLRALLPRVLEQQADGRIELIAIDSGSTDDTTVVLHEFDATVIAITPGAFARGLAHNLACRYAEGAVLVFVNPRAAPADNQWLSNLVAPLAGDATLAGVCSRVLPGPDADLLSHRDAAGDPCASPERSVRRISDWPAYWQLSPTELRRFLNFHTLSAAIRPQALQRIPFREASLLGEAEDVFWAKEVLEAGWRIQHEPASVVRYANEYSVPEIMQRNIENGISYREMLGQQIEASEVESAIAALIQDDWRYLEDELQLTGAELDRWRLQSATRRTAQILGQWYGVNMAARPE